MNFLKRISNSLNLQILLFIATNCKTLFSGLYSDIFSLLFLSVICKTKKLEFWRTKKTFWRTQSKVNSLKSYLNGWFGGTPISGNLHTSTINAIEFSYILELWGTTLLGANSKRNHEKTRDFVAFSQCWESKVNIKWNLYINLIVYLLSYNWTLRFSPNQSPKSTRLLQAPAFSVLAMEVLAMVRAIAGHVWIVALSFIIKWEWVKTHNFPFSSGWTSMYI